MTLRRTLLQGSEREVALDEPLGGPDFGLDSLSLVGFLTALEVAFEVELDPALWSEQEGLTLRHLIDRIHALAPAAAPVGAAVSAPSTIERPGAPRTPLRWIFRLAQEAARRTWVHHRYRILERVLDHAAPVLATRFPLELRLTRPEEAPGVVELFGPRRGPRNLQELRERIASGYLCLGAWHEGRWAGIDYMTGSRHWHGFLNLAIVPAPGHVYAFGLVERSDLRGVGVGLALLAASIDLARERGYRRQFAIVDRGNERMLAASVQIFGFRVVGELESWGVAGVRRTLGHLRGERVGGGTLIL